MTLSPQSIRCNATIRIAIEHARRAYNRKPVSVSTYDDVTGPYFDGYATVQMDPLQKVLFIAFRGTDSIVDLAMDCLRCRAPFEHLPGTLLHGGALRQYIELRPGLLTHVARSVDEGCTQIVVTGHSLGGALATICATDVANHHPAVPFFCYPLNSPRVGNQCFVDTSQVLLNLSILRINTRHDCIPWVPYCGYAHTPEVVELPVSVKHQGVRFYNVWKRHSIAILQKTFDDL